MIIHINGEIETVTDGLTLASLVEQKNLLGKRIAIEVNEELITRNDFSTHTLQDGDQVEIVQAIGGG
jgi:thiamine biosynthesis protein ThiS